MTDDNFLSSDNHYSSDGAVKIATVHSANSPEARPQLSSSSSSSWDIPETTIASTTNSQLERILGQLDSIDSKIDSITTNISIISSDSKRQRRRRTAKQPKPQPISTFSFQSIMSILAIAWSPTILSFLLKSFWKV